MKNSLIEEVHLTEKNRHSLKPDSGEHVFRYCYFEGIKDLELQLGVSIESSFLCCTFRECTFYEPFFNDNLFFRTKFKKLHLSRGLFPNLLLRLLRVHGLPIGKRQHGGECLFDDVRWYDCRARRSPGARQAFLSRGRSTFIRRGAGPGPRLREGAA